MKYYLIAGEASGDLHGSNLMKELRKSDPRAEFRFWGGDKMAKQGGTPVKHIRELAFMGFKEVILNLPAIFKNIKFCKQDILQFKPDAVIFIDYPGFNFQIAPFTKKQGIKNIYYISPQLWAWNQKRAKKIKKMVDKMLVILPFEEEFYKAFDYKVDYVGHPLLDVVQDFYPEKDFLQNINPEGKPLVAILPGSRKQEIKLMLPEMLKAAAHFPQYQFVVAGAPAVDESNYSPFLDKNHIPIIYNKTHHLLSFSTAAMVTSGTATLETALFNVPEVVCYKGGYFSFALAKKLVKVKYICLVNLIMDKPVVKELIQDDFTTENLTAELQNLVENKAYRESILEDYRELRQLLGNKGASAKAAEIITSYLK